VAVRILLADDDRHMVRALTITLRAHDYEVIAAADGRQALDAAAQQHPDLIVLDLGMPGLTGVEVIQAVRGWSTVPILVISGRSESSDKVDALDAGADDYVTKPFAVDELLARVRALTRRAPAADDETPTVTFGEVSIDLAQHSATRAGRPVRLTPTEWRLLEELVRHPGQLVTREALLTTVWGPHFTNDSGYLRLYLSQLRKKLEVEPSRPRHLLTEAGMGYRFVIDPPAERTTDNTTLAQ
jgi:two-component system KDP operon response regulator KdpE